jgi:hypothetical protein
MILFIKTIYSNSKKELQEGLQNSIIINKGDAFCEKMRGTSHILEEKCGSLTQNNCNSTSCCIWTSNDKCVAGNESGATFNSDTNGKTQTLDYFYYQNKCYGSGCDNN